MSVLGQEGAWSLQPLPSLSFPPFVWSLWEGPFTPPALLVGVSLLGGPFAEGRARELPPWGGHQGRVWQWMGPCKGLLAILLLISSCSWRPLVPAGPGVATWQGQAERGVLDLHPGGLLFGGREPPALGCQIDASNAVTPHLPWAGASQRRLPPGSPRVAISTGLLTEAAPFVARVRSDAVLGEHRLVFFGGVTVCKAR